MTYETIQEQGRGGPPGLGKFSGRPLKIFYVGPLDFSSLKFLPFVTLDFIEKTNEIRPHADTHFQHIVNDDNKKQSGYAFLYCYRLLKL